MLLADFCLRLSFGLLASLLLLWNFDINPRFTRIHFLTAVGLISGCLILLVGNSTAWLWYLLLGSLLLCALGSMAWYLDKAPGGRILIVLGTLCTGSALVVFSQQRGSAPGLLPLLDDFTSAGVLGTATTGMLLGHSYLIAPTMSIQPLLRINLVMVGSLILRVLLALYTLWIWTGTGESTVLVPENVLWLVVRWGIGFVAPLILGWMAWETARIRSTQSATGILYVVVIMCFLGELTSQLLFLKTSILV